MAKKLKWRLVLGVGVAWLAAVLLTCADFQTPPRGHWAIGWVPPATIAAAIISGPGYIITPFLPMPRSLHWDLNPEMVRLPGIAIFWYFVGWAIDRRLREKRAFSQTRPRTALLMFGLLGLLAGSLSVLFVFGTIQTLRYEPTVLRRPFPSIHWVGIAEIPWMLALTAYAGVKVFRAFQAIPSGSSPTPN
jgi:hypothetical protein